ncbi:EAL domain-containing protein [Accumulibacter sp.]|uniref:bifunctional diguanylate cyclase/phosphodiesterase n=1 Tax=Accumulibacter sp. TaxID=2053492 RepID=UPI0025DA126C|nr:EAL domain-containing protein [Accumulibacter sp.]MCM8594156.1 EAL domain-containing protein [Accumulibacter sp.]MCM8625718.1 EAL domain-containing protein [Accumulibacter sp.]MDS4048299.1 EAL domain-containing protein [Accumulibacter sp.]
MAEGAATDERPGRSRFLSLKWKVLLTLGVAMLSVNGALSWHHYRDLKTRFEEQRAEIRQRLVAEAFALRNDFGRRLQALAGMLAALDSVGVSLFQTPAGNALLRQHFDSYWPALQLDLGIDSVQVYARSGAPLLSWSTSSLPEAAQDAQVHTVIAEERAMHWTSCRQTCSQFAAAPILSEGQVAGAVVLGSSLADVVNSFQQVTNADLGVLVPATDRGALSDNDILRQSGLRATLLSSKGKARPVLQQLASIPQIPDPPGHASVSLSHEERHYELSFLALVPPDGKNVPPMMVVIDDLTGPLKDITDAVLLRLAGELAVSLASLGVLAWLVNSPLRRMTRTAEAIPFLGRSAFAEARNRIAPRRRRLVDDEIDSLDEAAIALSYRLEELEAKELAHKQETDRLVQEISAQRDFSSSLLDTAQVIILTQRGDGRIHSVNRYGSLLSGWNKQELIGKPFLDLIGEDQSRLAAMREVLQEIAAGERLDAQMESIVCGKNGQHYEITWNHSRLSVQLDESVTILSVGIDHTERKRAESDVKRLAERDVLTDLVNRKRFQIELADALISAHRLGTDGALLYLDLDNFKYVNDVSGHQAGDELLKDVAKEVGKAARASDLLGRLGGDELGLLLHECDREGAIQVAEKINRRLAERKYPGLGANHRVSASIGIVVFSEASSDAVDRLLANADIAMYQAKKKGGAGWHVYSEGEGVQEKMQSRLYWEEMINRSLASDGLIVHYQPILDIRARQVSHYEALVRMRGADGSVIAPGMFMEIAEHSGLIRQIDRQVIRQVFARMIALFAAGRYYRFSINLSAVSINDPTLLSFIRHETSRSPMLPSHVVFEITETAAVSDFSSARAFMDSVREIGCSFSLDDFGVGFSSFNYVKQLPVDYVKIDGSFVRTLVDSPDDQVFVRALAEVARGFGKKTVAEFVEDERALNMLRSFGVDYAQGYFIGRPTPEVS